MNAVVSHASASTKDPSNGMLTITVEADAPVIIGRYGDRTGSGSYCEDNINTFLGVTSHAVSIAAGITRYFSVGTAPELVGPYSISYTFAPN